jgi:hypothetical protein
MMARILCLLSCYYLPFIASIYAINVKCRITVIDTLIDISIAAVAQETQEMEIGCIPIFNERESDELYSLSGLPEAFRSAHLELISQGRLVVLIKGVKVTEDVVELEEDAELIIDSEGTEKQRKLQDTQEAIGRKSLMVVRVSAQDTSPVTTLADLEGLFADTISMKTQYSKCSFGQLEWVSAGVVDVVLDDASIASFSSGSSLVYAASEKLSKDRNVTDASELADRVVFCLPNGTGNWAARAAVRHWRAQFNDEWCTSLTATMHEIGKLSNGCTIGFISS